MGTGSFWSEQNRLGLSAWQMGLFGFLSLWSPRPASCGQGPQTPHSQSLQVERHYGTQQYQEEHFGQQASSMLGALESSPACYWFRAGLVLGQMGGTGPGAGKAV